MSIVQTDAVLEGRRISMSQTADRVIEVDQSPEYIADQLNRSIAEIYHALAYYYDHIEDS